MVMKNDYISHHGIQGMRWGIRRYQNPDGSLTAEGKARWERDKKEQSSKKAKNREDTTVAHPERWDKEDKQRRKSVVDASKNFTNSMSQTIDAYSNLDRRRAKRNQKRANLSKYSDQELRSKINRELLERQYNDIFNAPKTRADGAEAVRDILQVVGGSLAVVSSSLGIALAVKELKGK